MARSRRGDAPASPSGDGAPSSADVRRRRRPLWVLLVLLLAAGGGAWWWSTARTTGTPTDVDAGHRFDVTVEVDDVTAVDNGRLFGRDRRRPPDAVVDRATRRVGKVVNDYLDAMFVVPTSRFSRRPLSRLLTRDALRATPDDPGGGLGVLRTGGDVQGRPVTVAARVLVGGAEVTTIVVDYHLRAPVVTENGTRGSLRQRATMVFVPGTSGWRAAAVEATLDMPSDDEGGGP